MVKLKKLYSSLSCLITSFDKNDPQPRCINNVSDAKKMERIKVEFRNQWEF